MTMYADIYLIKKSRSFDLAIDFLNHFVPNRKESSDEYTIPQYDDKPKFEFDSVKEIMLFLEKNIFYYQGIYWQNIEDSNLNKHAMIFYLEDGYTVFGISIEAKENGEKKNEEKCLQEMVNFFNSKEAYITYEDLPGTSYLDFKKKIKST